MAAAIRKFFKSPDKKEKAAQKDKGDGAASGPAGDPMVLAVAGAIVPSGSGMGSAAGGGGGVGGSGSSSNHHSHHHYGGGGGAGSGSGSGNASSKTNGTDSPMRRLRW